MPIAVSPRSRQKYARALRDIDEAVVLLGEALRDDAEVDAKTVMIAIEELRDAAERIRSRVGRVVKNV